MNNIFNDYININDLLDGVSVQLKRHEYIRYEDEYRDKDIRFMPLNDISYYIGKINLTKELIDLATDSDFEESDEQILEYSNEIQRSLIELKKQINNYKETIDIEPVKRAMSIMEKYSDIDIRTMDMFENLK